MPTSSSSSARVVKPRPLAPLLWGLGPTMCVALFVGVVAVANGEPWLAAPAVVALVSSLLYIFGPTLARPLRRAWRWCFPTWHLFVLLAFGIGCGQGSAVCAGFHGGGGAPEAVPPPDASIQRADISWPHCSTSDGCPAPQVCLSATCVECTPPPQCTAVSPDCDAWASACCSTVGVTPACATLGGPMICQCMGT